MKPRVSGQRFPGRCCWLAGLGVFPFQVLGRSWAEIASVISGRWGVFSQRFRAAERWSCSLQADNCGSESPEEAVVPSRVGTRNFEPN